MKVRLALLPLLLLLSAVPAAAQQQRDDLWVTNGDVSAMQLHNNNLFIAGQFTRVGPATGSLAAVHVNTGVRTLGSLGIDGTINVLAPDGMGGFYVGGSFTKVLGQTRYNAARIDASGNLKPWSPQVEQGVVRTMVLAGDKVFLGGSFFAVGGQVRLRLAAIDTTNGLVQAFHPNADGEVFTLAHLNGVLYVGGAFANIGVVARNRIAALDPFTGTPTAFNPNSNGTVHVLAPYFDSAGLETWVYAGGSFTSIGGQARTNLALLDATVGSPTFGQATPFNPAPNGVVRTLDLSDGIPPPTLYVGGDFTNIAGQPRNRVASFNGFPTLNAWNPNADGPVYALRYAGGNVFLAGSFANLGGQPRSRAGSVNAGGAAVTSAWNPSPFGTSYALGTSGNNVWIGGSFPSVGGVARANLAEIDLATGQPTSWNPSPPEFVAAIDWVGNYLYYSTGAYGLGRIDAAGVIDSWNEVGGRVHALAHGANNILYVGGTFTEAGLEPRSNLAAFSTGSPPVLQPWAPAASNLVTCLAVDATHVYVGGWFTQLAGHNTQSIGRVDFAGNHQGWTAPPGLPFAHALAVTDTSVVAALVDLAPAPTKTVTSFRKTGGLLYWTASSAGGLGSALSVGPNGILVGGHFSDLSNQPRTSLCRVEHHFGLVYPWDPQVLLLDSEPGYVYAIVEHNGVVYVAGDFDLAQGKLRGGLAGLYEATTAVGLAPRSAAIALRATPNPARGTQAFAFDLAAPAEARVTIHNVSGRIVRVIQVGILPAGPHRLEWDGRTDAGIEAAPGLYFVKLDAGATAATTKVLRID